MLSVVQRPPVQKWKRLGTIEDGTITLDYIISNGKH
jgi:hypothetical protein